MSTFRGFLEPGYSLLDDLILRDGRDVVGDGLVTGRLEAVILDSAGNLIPRSRAFWRTSEGADWLSVPDDRRYVKENAPAAKVRAPGTGGRPQKHDWEGALLALFEMEMLSGTMNKTDPELQRFMHEWFVRETGEDAPDSQVRERVKRYRKAIPKS